MVALNDPNAYENKFAEFIALLAETREDMVMIHHPEVIGDTYEELVESLNRLADAGKKLMVVPRGERD
jgi:hypothetical protein